MRRKINILLLVIFPFTLKANNDRLLAEIEANNLSLKALRSQIEAKAEENLSSATLSDPSLEFAYLWGPEGIGRKDISVEQSFDYATISGIRHSTALRQNDLLQIEYKLSLRSILLDAKNLVSEITYRNALLKQYKLRLYLAEENEKAYKKGLELGEFSIIQYRNASLALTLAKNQYYQIEIERDELLQELSLLNGGKEIQVLEDEIQIALLPKDFDTWLNDAKDNSTTLEYYSRSLVLSEEELKLSKSEAVPSLSLGYAAELVPGSDFHGIKFGLSIPLWSSGKKINAAKKAKEASEEQQNAAILEFGIRAKALYTKALGLSSLLTNTSNEIILEIEQALKMGQISIIEAIESSNEYYGVIEQELLNKLNYSLVINELESL